LKFPLFNKSQWAKINQSKINVESTNNELSIATQSLQTQAQQLLNTLQLLQHAVQLYQNSIKEKETLLQTAKVSFSIDQMTIEDYLKYEDDVVFEKTKLYKTQAQIWQTLMKLAVIYGNDIQTIVK
jgi:outer membrane protein TolC